MYRPRKSLFEWEYLGNFAALLECEIVPLEDPADSLDQHRNVVASTNHCFRLVAVIASALLPLKSNHTSKLPISSLDRTEDHLDEASIGGRKSPPPEISLRTRIKGDSIQTRIPYVVSNRTSVISQYHHEDSFTAYTAALIEPFVELIVENWELVRILGEIFEESITEYRNAS